MVMFRYPGLKPKKLLIEMVEKRPLYSEKNRAKPKWNSRRKTTSLVTKGPLCSTFQFWCWLLLFARANGSIINCRRGKSGYMASVSEHNSPFRSVGCCRGSDHHDDETWKRRHGLMKPVIQKALVSFGWRHPSKHLRPKREEWALHTSYVLSGTNSILGVLHRCAMQQQKHFN